MESSIYYLQIYLFTIVRETLYMLHYGAIDQ